MVIKELRITLVLMVVVLLSSLDVSYARAINDGTLPLGLMSGNAFDLSIDPSIKLNASVKFLQIDKEDLGQNATFDCISGNDNFKLNAKGKMNIKNKFINIKGLCVNTITNKIEIIGDYNGSETRLNGSFNKVNKKTVINGRLQIEDLPNARFKMRVQE